MQRSHVIEPPPGRWQEVKTYLGMGVGHILMGVDHLLFVLGLLLIVRDRWMLLKTITAFTVAHSITLGIATMGWANAPTRRSTRPSHFDSVSRPGNRARAARRNQPDHPASVGGGRRVRMCTGSVLRAG